MPVTVGNTAPTVTIEFPPDGGFFDWGDQVKYTVTVTDPEDGDDRLRPGAAAGAASATTSTPTRWSSTPAAPAPCRPRSPPGTARRRTSSRVFEATYTDDGGAGGAGAADRPGDRAVCSPSASRPSTSPPPAGRPAASAAATRACSAETTTDTAGGCQNIGFIEDGDWWSLDPANLTGIDVDPVPGRLRRRRRADRGPRRRGRRPAGRPRPTCRRTGGWQTCTDVTRAGHRHGDAGRCSSSPGTRPAHRTGSLFNVNWVDFLGRGVTENAPPTVSARRRRRPPAPRRSRSRSTARPPTPRATPR